jgi:hypothetical protein
MDDFEDDGEQAGSGATDRIVTLNFDWRAHRFIAHLDRCSVRENLLRVSCDLGPLPFSAEGVERRLNIFAVLDATQTGRHVRTTVSRKQRIGMIAEARLQAPVTTNAFLAKIVELLAQARPYIDMLQMLQQQQPARSVRLGQ